MIYELYGQFSIRKVFEPPTRSMFDAKSEKAASGVKRTDKYQMT